MCIYGYILYICTYTQLIKLYIYKYIHTHIHRIPKPSSLDTTILALRPNHMEAGVSEVTDIESITVASTVYKDHANSL